MGLRAQLLRASPQPVERGLHAVRDPPQHDQRQREHSNPLMRTASVMALTHGRGSFATIGAALFSITQKLNDGGAP